mmetsp:Transcript_36100/g.58264  ORF Transcript_36100/g.58264 Transcript_36100/m.58264 type:complete len:366 (+) Transcript_36100:92-1189(+)|eukprot:CAMPEP_0115099594 /NCGR_PEP_ID=MMETSP0227-20121206/31968_1 /TAXON_ID=89957 /ORGANISM="Polarella glacialis, Strain CCMP 1383" /LENGTH=365 /DNA_ID=CAMNT_0002494661 /DNA_START=55 /DNA_END=1152 /DNA_ORIENTATION=-
MPEAALDALARVLVTGGQGFIGAYVIRDLLRRGSKVVLLDLKDSPHILAQVLLPDELSQIQKVFADIADARTVRETVLSFKPTAVIHLAGMQIPGVRENPLLGASVNVNGTINIFEAVRALASHDALAAASVPVPVVYASSAAVLGPSSDYAQGTLLPAERDNHMPRTLYGVLKLANEGTARIYWQDYGVPSVGLRPLTVFGVGREVGLTSAPTKAVKAAVLGRSFVCQVAGRTGFQYVVDVARMFVDSAAAAAGEARGAHVFGMRGHLNSYEEFLQAAALAVPAVAKLASVAPNAAEVPIHADVDEEPLEALLRRKDLHTPLAKAVAEMAADFQALQKKGALSDNDLGPPPAGPPPTGAQSSKL